jgi:ferrous iron transport protein B
MAITKAAALAYLMFNLYSPPCFAAIGAMNAEMKSAKWLWGGIALQLYVGFTIGFLVYQVGTFVSTGAFGAGFVPGLVAVALVALILTAICIKSGISVKKEIARKRAEREAKKASVQ